MTVNNPVYQLLIFALSVTVGIVGGIITVCFNALNKKIHNKIINHITDFVITLINFFVYLIGNIFIENGQKRIFTLIAYVIGWSTVLQVSKFVLKK